MSVVDATSVDPTLLVRESDVGKTERAVLLVYRDVGEADHSRLIEIPDGAEIGFGRSRRSTVHVDADPVSRHHCVLKRTGRGFLIEDLESRNGTLVNGEKISGATVLASGDEIQVGPVTAVLSITSLVAARRRLGTTAYLDERLRAECDRCQRYQRSLALLMIRFEGDVTRIDAAIERLAGRMRPMDTLCEYSPNELAVIVPEADEAGARLLADRLTHAARGALGDRPEAVRIGMSLAPANGTSPDELIGEARAALRAANVQQLAVSTPPIEPGNTQVIACDPQMKRLFALAQKVAASNITVLVLGETGAGKEIIAGSIHDQSPRADKACLRLNCASIPESLLESELFGHEKGSFTGAEKQKIGFFEAAKQGTVFLDEIGEMSLNVQAKLLRVLENRTITRVGGTSEIDVDVRIVCATNRDLELEVREGRFREDLYYRISAFSLVVPALRDRPGDILPLCEHFVRINHAALPGKVDHTTTPVLTEEAKQYLQHYDWPGNVRQLRNAMERAVVLASNGVIEVGDLPDRVREAKVRPGQSPIMIDSTLDVRDQLADVEKTTIQAALAAVDGNQTKAAKRIGISRRALIYKMEKYGLKEPPASRRND
jgi:two-component system response regulator AtoC